MSLKSKGFVMCIALVFWVAPLEAQPAQGTWSKAAPLPGVRSELQAVALGDKIYAIGGNTVVMRDGKTEIVPDSGINEVYDPATDSWRALAPMPMGANHTGIAAMGGKVYVG